MKLFRRPGLSLVAVALLVAGAASAAAPPVPAFTARYRVLRDGSPIGAATLTLEQDRDGAWTFTTVSEGTAGLASLLEAGTREVSTFHWIGGLPQCDRYDYTLSTRLKERHRTVRCDWTRSSIEVDDHGAHTFAAEPGTLERHTVPLALAAGLAAGQTEFTLPVAVRDRIEMQRYAAHGVQAVTVPAGTFDAIRVTRTDGGDGFEAWFAPSGSPAPVKIDLPGKQHFALELERWSGQP